MQKYIKNAVIPIVAAAGFLFGYLSSNKSEHHCESNGGDHLFTDCIKRQNAINLYQYSFMTLVESVDSIIQLFWVYQMENTRRKLADGSKLDRNTKLLIIHVFFALF